MIEGTKLNTNIFTPHAGRRQLIIKGKAFGRENKTIVSSSSLELRVGVHEQTVYLIFCNDTTICTLILLGVMCQ